MKALNILITSLIFLGSATSSAQPCNPPENPNCPIVNFAEYQAYCGVPVEMFGYNWDIDNFYACGDYSDIVTATLVHAFHTEVADMPTYWKGQTSYGDWFIEGTPDLQAGYTSGYYLYDIVVTRVYPGWDCQFSFGSVLILVE